jgi:uncharacterized damage-inducible protein DinB
MSPESRTEIVQILKNGRQEFLESVSGLSEADVQAHPQAGRWSVLECVEHVNGVEERFLSRLQNAAREGAPPMDKQKETELLARIKNRTTRAEAPEPVRPIGRYQTLAEALAQFQAARARTIRFAEEQSAHLYSMTESHPRFGTLNGTEMLILITAHALRHAEQIRELRADLGK